MGAFSAGDSIPGETRAVEDVDLVDLQGNDKCRQTYMGTLVRTGERPGLFVEEQSFSATSM